MTNKLSDFIKEEVMTAFAPHFAAYVTGDMQNKLREEFGCSDEAIKSYEKSIVNLARDLQELQIDFSDTAEDKTVDETLLVCALTDQALSIPCSISSKLLIKDKRKGIGITDKEWGKLESVVLNFVKSIRGCDPRLESAFK